MARSIHDILSSDHLQALVLEHLSPQFHIHGTARSGFWFSPKATFTPLDDAAKLRMMDDGQHLISWDNGSASHLDIRMFGDAQLDIYDYSDSHQDIVAFMALAMLQFIDWLDHRPFNTFSFQLLRAHQPDWLWHKILRQCADDPECVLLIPEHKRMDLAAVIPLINDGNTIMHILAGHHGELWLFDFLTS